MLRSRYQQTRSVRSGVWVSIGIVLAVLLLARDSFRVEEALPVESDPVAAKGSTALPAREAASAQADGGVDRTVEFKLPPVQPEHLPMLLAELSSLSPQERAGAAAALGRLGFLASDAVPALTRIAEEDPDEGVRKAAGTALLNIRGYAAPSIEF